MSVNIDDMTMKQLRKHAKDVAKALTRMEAARAKKLGKRVVSYTQELGENFGGFFSKKMTNDTETPPTEAIPTEAEETPSAKAIPTKAENSKPPKYVEPDGTPRQRLGKWSEKYTTKQIEKMKQK
jgi:hypothetical protein